MADEKLREVLKTGIEMLGHSLPPARVAVDQWIRDAEFALAQADAQPGKQPGAPDPAKPPDPATDPHCPECGACPFVGQLKFFPTPAKNFITHTFCSTCGVLIGVQLVTRETLFPEGEPSPIVDPNNSPLALRHQRHPGRRGGGS